MEFALAAKTVLYVPYLPSSVFYFLVWLYLTAAPQFTLYFTAIVKADVQCL